MWLCMPVRPPCKALSRRQLQDEKDISKYMVGLNFDVRMGWSVSSWTNGDLDRVPIPSSGIGKVKEAGEG